MKKIFSSILMMLCAITVMAQNDYVATLQHGESVSYYYGTDAFVSAYNAAAEGDIITLSSGTFTGCSVEKGITVRGVGIDAENQATTINTEVKIYSPSAESVTTFEGITFTSNVQPYADGTKAPEAGRILFLKDCFNPSSSIDSFIMQNTSATVAATPKVDIIACVFNQTPNFSASYSNVKITNSLIRGNRDLHTTKSNVDDTSFNNCLIYNVTFYSYNGSHYYCSNASFTNCIFKNYYSSWTNTRLHPTVSITNCIADNSVVFNDIPQYTQQGNKVVSTSTLDAMFKSGAFPTTWTKGTTFELTDEAAATYLGVDNTQVGMHGGMYPYNSTVGYPVVTTFNVAGKTTNTGDLNIEVKVNNEE